MLASGLAELISLGSVLPFLTVLSSPERLWESSVIRGLAIQIGILDPRYLLIPSAIVFAFSAIIAASIRLANLWLNGRLAAAVGTDLSCQVYKRTLFQPYEVHLRRNSAEVITSTTTQIARTVVGLNAFLQFITALVVSSGLLVGLLLIDASVSLSAAAIFCSAYIILAFATRRELQTNSRKIALASAQQLKYLQEGLCAIRDVLLSGNQLVYLDIYRKTDLPLRMHKAKNSFLGSFPRYALEALGMVAIAALGGFLFLKRGSGTSIIPLLGAMSLGAQRLLPALQQMYGGWSILKGDHAAINDVLSMLNQPIKKYIPRGQPLILHDSVCLCLQLIFRGSKPCFKSN